MEHERVTDAAMTFDWLTEADRTGADDMAMICARLREDVTEMEPIVSAAVMVATAFRMKDEASLVDSLRRLSEAVKEFERVRG